MVIRTGLLSCIPYSKYFINPHSDKSNVSMVTILNWFAKYVINILKLLVEYIFCVPLIRAIFFAHKPNPQLPHTLYAHVFMYMLSILYTVMGQGSSQDDNKPQNDDEVASGAIGEPRLYSAKFGDQQWPIIYKDSYNIGFLGLEKIHPFDAGKWGRIHKKLVGE